LKLEEFEMQRNNEVLPGLKTSNHFYLSEETGKVAPAMDRFSKYFMRISFVSFFIAAAVWY
jgi:hypothetical protein